jgi:methyl-accepting chemotaxis protein
MVSEKESGDGVADSKTDGQEKPRDSGIDEETLNLGISIKGNEVGSPDIENPQENHAATTAIQGFVNSKKIDVDRLFYVFLVAGVIGELTGFYYIAIASLAIYFLIGLTLTKSQKNSEKFADSLYYMGFIFTIWALVISLGPWATSAGDLQSSQILPLFGVALVTTAVGMTLRVVLLQGRHTVFDQEEEAKAAIDQSISNLTRELEKSSKVMKEANVRLADETSSLGRTLTEQLLTAGNTTQQELSKIILELQDKLSAHIDELNPSITAISKKLEAIDLPVDVIKDGISKAIGEITRELARTDEEIKKAATGFSQSINNGTQEIGAATSRFSEIGERLSRSSDSIKLLVEVTEKIASTVEKSAAASESAKSETANATSAFVKTVDSASTSISSFKSTADDFAAMIKELKGSINSDADKFTESFKQSAASVQGLVSQTEKNVERLEATISEGAEIIRGVSDAETT